MTLLTLIPDLIHYPKLSILGVNETYVFGLIMLCCLLAIYLIIEPITEWLIIAGSSKTISYFLTTLMMLILLLVFLLFNDSMHHLKIHLLKIAFVSFSIFGIVLAAVHYIKNKVFHKRKKTN